VTVADEEFVPTLADYAEIIDRLVDGRYVECRDKLPESMHRAYYDAIDRAGLLRVQRAMERIDGG
jgi:hypothetical protein